MEKHPGGEPPVWFRETSMYGGEILTKYIAGLAQPHTYTFLLDTIPHRDMHIPLESFPKH
jgi:hypothetical protein